MASTSYERLHELIEILSSAVILSIPEEARQTPEDVSVAYDYLAHERGCHGWIASVRYRSGGYVAGINFPRDRHGMPSYFDTIVQFPSQCVMFIESVLAGQQQLKYTTKEELDISSTAQDISLEYEFQP